MWTKGTEDLEQGEYGASITENERSEDKDDECQ